MDEEPKAVNVFDDVKIADQSFSYLDLTGQVKWQTWTPVYSFATATSLTVIGRYLVDGKRCTWQVRSTGTSLATTAGTSYIDLPIAAKGYGGMGMMTNDTSNISVGTGHVDVTTNRFYPPTQGASGNTFIFTGYHEI